jgi:hypothetical protein
MMAVSTVASLLLGNEWARLAAVAVLCLGFGFVRGWAAHPKIDIAALERNASAARDADWTQKITQQEREHEREMAAAREARDSTPIIAADADLAKLCNADAACRDKGGKGR